MLVIMKGLLSGYNIGLSTIHEAWNAKVLCLFAKAAYLDLFFTRYSIVQYASKKVRMEGEQDYLGERAIRKPAVKKRDAQNSVSGIWLSLAPNHLKEQASLGTSGGTTNACDTTMLHRICRSNVMADTPIQQLNMPWRARLED